MTYIYRKIPKLTFTLLTLLIAHNGFPQCRGNESIEGRFSFSLSTFDPSGKIGQVERALLASSLGTPIVAVIKEDRILLASPQILPSPLMEDDGTTRFAPVTPHIAIGHSGISADGRVLVAAAQQLAVEHAYTYDENIPIALFLEEMSLLYQEYTMTPGVRPFGASLLVAYMPLELDATKSKPQLFRLDPSGSVISYEENVVIVNGRFIASRSGLESSLQAMGGASSNATISEDRQRLSQLLQEAFSPKEESRKSASTGDGDNTVALPSAIVTASLTRGSGLEVERFKLLSHTSQ